MIDDTDTDAAKVTSCRCGEDDCDGRVIDGVERDGKLYAYTRSCNDESRPKATLGGG